MERRGRQHRHLGNNKKKEAAAAADALFQLDFVPNALPNASSCRSDVESSPLVRLRAAAEGRGKYVK